MIVVNWVQPLSQEVPNLRRGRTGPPGLARTFTTMSHSNRSTRTRERQPSERTDGPNERTTYGDRMTITDLDALEAVHRSGDVVVYRVDQEAP